METWVDIPEYEGLYQVSNMGNVRSLNWNKTGQSRNLFLKPHTRGYLQVELRRNGKRRMYTVHKLVARCFVGGYKEGLVVNHLNEDKTDNRAENLEWCTTAQNINYSRKNKKHPALKLLTPIAQFTSEGTLICVWNSATEIKHTLGFSDWSIKECCKGKRKQAYGYMWQYAA